MIRKITIICLLLLSSITMTSQTKSAAYLSNTSQPWGQNSNIKALNAVYDTDWTQYFYNSAVIAEIFVPDRAFVWMEGGSDDTSLMLNVINSNTALIESWVSNGGILLISAATNELTTPYSVGFGITSTRILTTTVVAADVNHPFFANATYTPILAPSYTGNYIAHNVHTGAGLTPILSSSEGTGDVFAEKPFGSGLVLFSGLTTPFFLTSSAWQPQPQMTNMLYAMIDYARNAGMTAVTNVTQTVGEFGYTFSVSGTTSYILVPSGATPPTAAQVAAGINYADVTILGAQTVSTTGGVPYTFNLSGLIPDTNYDIYVVTFYLEGGTNVYSDIGKTSFTTEPNDLPVGSAIANQSECVNGSLSGISLTITDAYPGDNTYTVTGSSSNTSLVPNGNIVITGSGSSRSIAITPNTGISGTSTITISMTDSLGATGTRTFTVTFNDTVLPTITAPAAINTTTNTACTATGVVLGTPTTADNCGVVSVTNNAPTAFPKGVTTVTWTVTDLGGNTKTATQTVTVTDNVNPTITAPATVISTACAPTALALGTPVTADNCSVASVTNNAPAIFPLGDTTVTWTVTDTSGNTATATQLVSVGDTIFPVVKTKNATVYLNNFGQVIITPDMIDNGTTDNCAFSRIVNPNNLYCGNVGENSVILIATDASGNQKIGTAIVTVVDNLPPTITAPAAVSAIANASCGATGVILGTPVTSDNCFIDTPAVNNAPATFPIGATTVTWTVTDRNGNSNTATQIVTVVDNQNPTIATLAATTVNADAGVCTYASSQLTKPSAADNCSVIVTASPVILVLGSNTVTWTATDGAGLTATSTQNVTVVDTQNPTIATLSAISVNADSGVCTYASSQLTAPTAADNCSVASVVASPASLNSGANTVTWTVTDAAGLTATSTQTVTVLDAQKPSIVTLDPISVNADAGVCTYASSQLTAPAALDNCSTPTVVASPVSLVKGLNTVTWTATDGSGNTQTSTQTVTVIDTQNPSIVTLDPISVNADAGVCTYASSQLTKPTAADNCSVASVIASPASLVLGENTVTWTATDAAGLTATSTQIVTVVDTQIPTIATLSAISVNADLGGCTYASSQLTAPTAADNCSVATVVASPASLGLGANTVTWTVTDGAGLTSTSTQTVTVVDAQNPTIVTLPAISVNADAGVCTYASSQLTKPSAADNCSVASVVASPLSLGLGFNTVTWTVTDGAGLTKTSIQNVTVVDTQNPTIATLSAISVNADAGVCTYDSSQLALPTAADNCSVATVVASPASLALGTNTVTWTATDAAGLIATSTQTVTVLDAQKPSIVTLDPISVNADLGGCTYASSQLTAPAALDNCSVATVEVSPASLILGNNIVTWTATDGSGNTQTSTQTVTVIDTQNPSIVTLDPISVNADSGVCTYVSSQLTKPTAADNCSVASVVATPATLVSGANTVTWTVTDASGLTATSTQIVTVIDTQNPTIATLPAISVNADLGGCTYASSQLTAPTAADNCSVATVVVSPASLALGANTVTWTVTDSVGLTATSTQTVTVVDSQKPTIATVDVVVSANASCNATGVDLGTPTTTDNCSVASVTNNAPTTFPLGDTTVTWTVTDGGGNTATTTQLVTVKDTTLPTITAPAAVTGNVNASCGATGVVLGTPTTADNCSVASVTNNAPAIFPLGETTVIWTVTDASGNIATATQLVTMGDTISPVVKAKNATVYLNSLGQAIILPSMIDNGTTDNCEFTLTVSPNNLVCANVGLNNVLLIATDASGNQSFKPATVTLVDNLAPVIVAPLSVSANANASCSATGIVLGTPVTTDNCTVDTVVNNAPATFPIGVTTVTWTVTDRSGNSATASQTVTVKDVSLPTVITKDITIQLDASGNATITAADIDNESSDNCGISTMTLSQDTFTISDTGVNTITLTVTDNSGNVSSATAQVTVDGTLSTSIPKSSTFLIYPMPFDSHINITLPDSYTEEVIYIQVHDLSGRAVYNQKHTVENHNVTVGDLKGFSDGSYYINLLDGNQNVIQSKHILKKSAY